MAYASITYTSASGTTFALTNSSGDPIEYLRQSDIAVTVNGTLKTQGTDYTFNSAGTAIVLATAVSGATVVITRTTSITDATVSFTAGSTLTAQDLNNSDKQNRFALQEFSDTYAALTTGTGDLSALAGFIGSAEPWLSDNAHAATTGAIDVRVDNKIDAALTGDIIAGTDISIADNTPGSGQITIAHNVAGANTTVNNSNGTVLQDITVTAQGHVTSVGSYDLDNRYYTETESDAKYVDFTSTQSISGAKTFSFSPVIPTPTLSNHAVTKGYVDAFIAAGITDGDKGDITVSGTGTVFTIDDNAVVASKINNGAVTPAKLSTGGPTWNSAGLLFANNVAINNATPSLLSDGLSFTDTVPISSSYANRISFGQVGGFVRYGFGVSSGSVHYVSDTQHNFYNYQSGSIQKVAQLDKRLMLGAAAVYPFAETTRLVVQGNNTNDTTHGIVDLMRGSIANPGDLLGSIRFRDTYSTPQSYYASIGCIAEATPSPISYLGALTFSTNTNSSVSPVERMRIDSSGRVLVGTSTYAGNGRLVAAGNTGGNAGTLDICSTASRPTAANTDIGYLRWYVAENSSSNAHYASIYASSDGASSSGSDIPGRLVFSTTADGASSPTERMRIGADGLMRITNGNQTFIELSNTGGYSGFHVVDGTAYTIGQNSNVRALRIGSGSGWLTTGVNLAAGGTSWGTYSDERLKEDIVELNGCLEQISDIRCVTYRLKDVDDADSKKRLGVIAQDLEGKFDEALNASRRSENDETEYLSVQYADLVPVLIKSLQEAKERIETLEAKVAALEAS